MASIALHFSSHLLPPPVHPSLNLDLSLGRAGSSLFDSDPHHVSLEALSSAQSCAADLCNEASAPPISTGPCICDSETKLHVRANASPALYLNEPVDLPKSKVLQAQRWHAARKRRKSIIEEKLHRRLNGDNPSGEAHMSRLPNGVQGFDWGACGHDIPSAVMKQGVPCDLGHGMPSGIVHDASCDLKHGMDRDVPFPIQPLTSCTSCGHGGMRSCVPYCGSNAPQNQCSSYGHTQMTSCAPCVNVRNDQHASCGHVPCSLSLYSQPAQCTAPTYASSSSPCMGMLFEKRRKVDDASGDDDDKQKSCNSSSSGLENECVKYAQSNTPNESMEVQSNRCDSKGGHPGAVYSSVAMPGSSMTYPYTLPMMPLSYPYAMPPQWPGSSAPRFMQYLPQMAFGTVSPSSNSQPNEATSLPHSLPLSPYHRPAHDNKIFPLYSFISAAGTENVIPELNDAESTDPYHARHEDQGVTVCGQEKKIKDDAAALSTARVANVVMKNEGIDVVEESPKFNLKEDIAMKCKQVRKRVYSEGFSSESPEADSTLSGICEGQVAYSGKNATGRRQQSLPVACERVSKKPKFVRFNSLDNKVILLEHRTQSISDESNSDQSNSDKSNDEMGCTESVDGKNDAHIIQSHSRVFEDELGDRSFADLPRVTTQGLGPLGKTIYGVMYITKVKQARLICRCHGKHMSPAEFVQHSGSNDLSNPERSILLTSSLPHVVSDPCS